MENKLTCPAPDGVYRWIWEWLDCYFQEAVYQEIHPRHEAELPLPKCLKEDWAGLFQLNSKLTTFPAYITAIPNGRVCGGAVISQDNKLIPDPPDSHFVDPFKHWIFQQNQLPPVEYRKGNAAVLTTIQDWQHNYYHWMFDCLAKLDLLEQSGLSIDWYIINPRAHSFQYETLHSIGIPEEKIIESHPGVHLQADRLVLTSQPTLTPDWACRYLSKSLKKYIDPNPDYRKVYISRADAYYRKVTNEEEVTQFLAKRGFQIIHLGQMSFRQQMTVFASAQIIISPHGAGLTNLLFVNPGTKVIELFSPNYVHPIYWILSGRVGADYYYLLGNGTRQSESAYREWPASGGEANIEVNLEKLHRILHSMNLKP